MKRSRTVLLLAAAVILAESASAGAPSGSSTFPQPDSWPPVVTVEHAGEQLGPGVTYDRWRLSTGIGPLTVHVTTIDLRNPDVTIAVATHRGEIVGADEPLSSMADRAHAEAAINADYFDINESGAPLNLVTVGGRFLHQPDGAAAFLVGPGNGVTMGPVTLHATLSDAAGAKIDIGSINDWSKEAGLSLLTPEFGSPDLDADLELVLTPTSAGGAYRVASVGKSIAHLLPLGPSDLGIAARGAEQIGRLSVFAVGDAVSLAWAGDPAPSSISYAAGGGPLLLRDGNPAIDSAEPAAQESNVRYPVTGAGVSADGSTLWLVAVDGRAPDRSVGITRPMLRSLLARLGAAQAMAFDSGGSTEMTIRHLGDPSVSVANVPSDGKERSIADALIVLNSATPGPIAQLLLRADAPAVFAGSHVQVHAVAVDANMQPAALDRSRVAFNLDSSCCGSANAAGVVAGLAPGSIHLTAHYDGVSSAPLPLDVIASPDVVTINGYARDAPAGTSVPLTIAASTRDGRAIAVDPSEVRWTNTGVGRVLGNGVFSAGSVPGIANVSARVGNAAASLRVLVGEHPVPLLSPGGWRFSANPPSIGGAVDALAAPDGSPALHLDFDFSQGGATRAAYAETQIPLSGEPLAISVDVYGDGNGEWLRGGYRNADGIVDSVTIARRVDWTGWRTIRAAIPPQARWPIAWTRLYAAEPRRDAIETGDLWFRNLNAMYAGPATEKP